MALVDENEKAQRGFPALRAQMRHQKPPAPAPAASPAVEPPRVAADPTQALIQSGATQFNARQVSAQRGTQASRDARQIGSPTDRPVGTRTLSTSDINPRTGLPLAGLGYKPGNSLQVITTERQPGPILIDPANPNFASLPKPPARNQPTVPGTPPPTPGAPQGTAAPRTLAAAPPDIGALPVSTAPSIADLRANPAPNTFVGRNGVRTIDASGNVQEKLNAGTLNTVPSTAFTAPGLGTLGVPGGDRPGASQRLAGYQSDVAGAQARNAATNARASEFNPSAIGDYRSKEGRAFAPILSAMQDIDSAAFRASMQANNPGARGRRGQEMLSSLLQTKAGLAQVPFAAASEQGKTRAQTAGALQVSQQQGQNALATEGARSQAQMNLAQFGAAAQPPTLFQSEQGYFQMDGGAAVPLLDASGKQIRPAVAAGGQLTPDALLKAYTEQAAAIQGGIGNAEEKQAATIELQKNPMFGPIFSAPQQGAVTPQQSAPGTLQQFIQSARAQGSKMGDAELTAYYNQEYGS